MENHLLYICVVFVLAGMVKGVTGMGLPTVAMALLGLVMPPLQAAAILVVPSLLTNVWQMLERRGLYAQWLRLRPMLAGVCAGTLVGGAFLAKGDGRAVLGAALLLYALLGLSSWRWQVRAAQEPWLGPLVGAATGVLTAVTGVFVLPAVPYLQALGLEKEELVQAMGLSFTVSTLALAVMLAGHGAWQPAEAGISFLAQLPALVGLALGTRLRARLEPQVFRRCFFITLLLLGGHLSLANW
ncbi:sulfite exporter TauE/SafE family protein [Pseudoduganella sp. SL102]|uniref:sulfite exporter TauE/SafE family protein n=1 Tax=Pseudoduganella sp. SL102 TaxID=2995154 RepID=UPI00248D21BC|nr:sulfite exporter TauE/SafE family protein [Pseudoduganella sp. SL102]WBS04059.1 sulfite exporter TauE/SafE family protein [Pseudoduganella sp. SL102]